MSNGSIYNGLNGQNSFKEALSPQPEPSPAAAGALNADDRGQLPRVDTMAQVRDLLFGEQQRQLEAQLTRFEREFRAEISSLAARLEVLERKIDHNSETHGRSQSAAFAELSSALGDVSDRLRRMTGY